MGTDKNAEFFEEQHIQWLERYLYEVEQRRQDMECAQWQAQMYGPMAN